MNLESDEKGFSLKAQFAKHAQDFDDLQNEMAGRDVGRISRFLSAEAREDRSNGKRGSRKESELTTLQILMMNDPEYAQLFRETEHKLRDVQTRLDTAMDAVLLAQEVAREKLKGTLSYAARAEEEARLEALIDLEADIISGQAEIGDMQERMADQDDPVAAEKIKGFSDRSEEIGSDVEERLTNIIASSEANFEPGSTQSVVGISIPEI